MLDNLILQASIVCNFKENEWAKVEEMVKNLVSDPILAPFGSNLSPKFFFSWILAQLDVKIVASYSCMQFQGKLMNQTWENEKKNLVSDPIVPKFGPPNSCFKYLAPSVSRYQGHLLPCTISEKTNDPILRILSDGRTDRRTKVTS